MNRGRIRKRLFGSGGILAWGALGVWAFGGVAGLGALQARAAVLQVPAQYPAIQQAIDAAGGGGEIQIAAGSYFEVLRVSGSRSLQLTALAPDGVSVGSSTVTLTLRGGVSLKAAGLRFEGGDPSLFATLPVAPVIWVEDSALELAGCRINQAVSQPDWGAGQDGLYCAGASEVRAVDCLLFGAGGAFGPAFGHGAAGWGGWGGRALVADTGASVTLLACQVQGGTGGTGMAASISAGTGGGGGMAVYASSCAYLDFQQCQVSGGGGGHGESVWYPNPNDPPGISGTPGAGATALKTLACPQVFMSGSQFQGGGGRTGGHGYWGAQESHAWGADSDFAGGGGSPWGFPVYLTENSTYNGMSSVPTPTPTPSPIPSPSPSPAPSPTSEFTGASRNCYMLE